MRDNIDDEGMRLLANLLQGIMPPNWGFTLLCFETDTIPAVVNYISSAERETMKETIRTMLNKWDEMDRIKKRNQN